MRLICTADLHLDNKPQHSYRWGIFDFLAKQQKKYDAKGGLILGDITDEKDCHSSSLVNRMVEGLLKLKPPVYILKGNHDYVDANHPYFGFLSTIPGLVFLSTSQAIEGNIAAIPHQPTQRDFDAGCKKAFGEIEGSASLVLLHGLFDGAIAETGQRLSGLSASLVAKNKPGLVLAGDVHRPQLVGGLINYVGAPYRVRFGDDYEPRVVCLDGCHLLDNLYFPCPGKHSLTIRDAEELLKVQAKKGDQIKLTIELAREEAVHWAEHKQRALDICRELGLELFGIKLRLPEPRKPRQPLRGTPIEQTHQAVLEGFCQAEDVQAEIKQAGVEMINASISN